MPRAYNGPGRKKRPTRSCSSIYRSQESQLSSSDDSSDEEQSILSDSDISVVTVPNTEFTMTPARIGSTSSSLINTATDWDVSGLLSRPSCTTTQDQNQSLHLPSGLCYDDLSILSDPQTQSWELIDHPMPQPGLGSTPLQYGAENVDAAPPQPIIPDLTMSGVETYPAASSHDLSSSDSEPTTMYTEDPNVVTVAFCEEENILPPIPSETIDEPDGDIIVSPIETHATTQREEQLPSTQPAIIHENPDSQPATLLDGRNDKQKQFACQECSDTFDTSRGLSIHKSRVHKDRPVGVSTSADAIPTCPSSNVEPAAPSTSATSPIGSTEQHTAPTNRNPNVLWGEATIDEIIDSTNTVYEKIVFFKQNLFKLPSGHAGKDFIRECTRLVGSWNTNSAWKSIAWKCIMIMPALLLQKPSSVSKSKDHTAALKRRLAIWKRGDFLELLRESQTIQGRLRASVPSRNIEATSKKFASLMKNGKVTSAVKLLTNSMEGGVLPLSEETMTLLKAKHPEPGELQEDAIVQRDPLPSHPVIFDEINGDSVRAAALKTHGGAGPSGLDADGWRHILASRNFGQASEDFRNEFATAIKKLCTELVDVINVDGCATSDIEAFLACRLIPLDKCPGLRPIGVGEVLRRIAGKVFMAVVKGDVQESVGSLQVCAGQAGGCEAAIHAMRSLYESEDTDAVLLIDAANAFNSMNRSAMLQNIERICPAAYIYAYNCYASHARLFVLGGKEIRSMEGTTQGDPPSMAFYAIGLLPLIWCLAEPVDHAKEAAYADDLTGAGKLNQLKQWFDSIVVNGPKLGYNAEPTKSWLIVKEDKLVEAEAIFADTGVNITTQGKKHLGASLGTSDYKNEFVSSLVKTWVDQIHVLSEIASYEPHAAYIAFTSCIRHRYTFYMRTIPGIEALLQPLENALRNKLIPALTDGRHVSDDERKLLSLPPRLGGMGLIMPSEIAEDEFENSRVATVDLANAIQEQLIELPPGLDAKSKEAKAGIRKARRDKQALMLEDIVSRLTPAEKRANEICRETGASNWLTSLPIEDKGFHLNKREFWDAVHLRYTWPISRLPSKCACGDTFNVGHALSCKKGGFVHRRHDAIRDMTGDLLQEVCHDVCIEPPLLELTGETLSLRTANAARDARLDISARGVWSRNQRAFFDVRVFDPNARSYQNQSLSQAYRANELEKKRHYNERVREIEHGTFTPLVFSVHGGMGQECKAFYKRLCSLLSEKRGENYSIVSSWVRTRTSFSLLRSALMAIRGTRHRYYQPKVADVDMELDLAETSVRDG